MLVDHREALLSGMVEGIVVVDGDGVITLANDSARRLLALPDDVVGRRVDELGLSSPTVALLRLEHVDAEDLVFAESERLLVASQSRIRTRGQRVELLTSVRDRSDLRELESALDDSRHATSTLRAQAHEFRNRLHTISVLVQLGDGDAALEFIDEVVQDVARIDARVSAAIADPTVAAMVIAKSTLARERGVELVVAETSRLGRHDERMSAELVTVVGNLIDNALDAVADAPVGHPPRTER